MSFLQHLTIMLGMVLLLTLSTSSSASGSVNDHLANGATPIIQAIEDGNFDGVVALLAQGADPRIHKIKKDEEYINGINLCLHKCTPAMAKLVLNYQDTTNGETPLIAAIYHLKSKEVHDLLVKGADPQLAKWDGTSAIDFALWSKSRLICHLVLNHQEANGETPLLIALYRKQFDLARKLIKGGARLDLKKDDGSGAFEFADWIEDGATREEIISLLNQAVERHGKKFDRHHHMIKTVTLLENIRPLAQHKQEFVSKQFTQLRSDDNQYDLNITRAHFGYKLPRTPYFQPYNVPVNSVFQAALPLDFLANVPEEILARLKSVELDHIDLFFLVQEFGYTLQYLDPDLDFTPLFRPHLWVDTDIPQQFTGERVMRAVGSELFSNGAPLPLHLHHDGGLRRGAINYSMVNTHDSKMSPCNSQTTGAESFADGQGISLWTLALDDDHRDQPRRAAVTLTWLVSLDDNNNLGRLISGGRLADWPYSDYGKKADQLQLLLDKLTHSEGYAHLVPSLRDLLR